MAKKIDRSEFLDKIRFEFGAIRSITRPQVLQICDKYGLDKPNWILNDVSRKLGRGIYSLPEHGAELPKLEPKIVNVATKSKKTFPDLAPKAPVVPATAVAMVAPSVVSPTAELSLVPEKATGYVPFGHFADVRSIIKS
ncbi:hypothetical protein EB001_27190, partial [bacterium]|nr:hypothetical protein [bacterium]